MAGRSAGYTRTVGRIIKDMPKKITAVQMVALRALDPDGDHWNPEHRPRGSLDRLAKKGLVAGGRKEGWILTRAGRAALIAARSSTDQD